MSNEEPRAKKTLNGRVLAIILLVVFGPIVGAVILRIFVVEAFKVPAGSMMPTLYVGDHMFVGKGNKKPERGEVIVFRYPENPSQDFVKRIAATSGDELVVVDGRPVVNGKLAPQCYVGPLSVEGTTQQLYLEKLGGRVYGVLRSRRTNEETCSATTDCAGSETCSFGVCANQVQGPYLVAPGEFWVLGDNRDNRHDSRMWKDGVGAGVPLDNVIGRPLWLYFSAIAGRSGVDVQGLPIVSDPSLTRAISQCATELAGKDL